MVNLCDKSVALGVEHSDGLRLRCTTKRRCHHRFGSNNRSGCVHARPRMALTCLSWPTIAACSTVSASARTLAASAAARLVSASLILTRAALSCAATLRKRAGRLGEGQT